MATIAKERAAVAAPPRRRRPEVSWSAWLWIAPALILVLVFFIYPLINTIILSFQNADSTTFVGLKNYQRIFTDPNMLEVLKNPAIWRGLLLPERSQLYLAGSQLAVIPSSSHGRIVPPGRCRGR